MEPHRAVTRQATRSPASNDREVLMSEDIDILLAERAIQRVLTTYSRGIDRFDFESVRACYWPD